MSPRTPLRRAVFLGAATVSATAVVVALTGGVAARAASARLSATFAQTSVWTTGHGTVRPGASASFGFTVAGTTTPTTPLPAGDVVSVSTAADLQAALANAAPGQAIKLASGTYRGSFVTTKAGTATNPISLSGPADAVLINDGPSGDAPE
ncbi:MAG TPA: hemagglutinin protein, partial [Amycolatopsis sp.]